LSNRFCFSGVTQNPRPFASGLGVHNLGISRARRDFLDLRATLEETGP
jgi:hypothetical protein